jgi:hydrogenase maturation protease
MARTLVIGYGNLERGDDGVAFHVVNRLRAELGRAPLAEDNSGLEGLGAEIDTVFVRQLVPELAADAAGYDRLVFCDAHVLPEREDLLARPVRPERRISGFGHLMHPEAFLWLVHGLSARRPDGYMVALRGFQFELTRRLSDGISIQMDQAVALIRHHLAGAAPVPLPHAQGGDP